MDLRDFQQFQGRLQHLEFKVWEQPNLKVSTLTLKYQFKKNWYCFHWFYLRCQHILIYALYLMNILACISFIAHDLGVLGVIQKL